MVYGVGGAKRYNDVPVDIMVGEWKREWSRGRHGGVGGRGATSN